MYIFNYPYILLFRVIFIFSLLFGISIIIIMGLTSGKIIFLPNIILISITIPICILFFIVQNPGKIIINKDKINIKSFFGNFVIKKDDINHFEQIDLLRNKEYTPVLRIGGGSVGRMNFGWFKLRNGKKAYILTNTNIVFLVKSILNNKEKIFLLGFREDLNFKKVMNEYFK